MIFPEEYKTIGVSFSEKTIQTDEKYVYFLSEFLLKEDRSGLSLYKISHTGTGFLRQVTETVRIAGPDEIVRFDRILNIKNRALLIETAARVCRENEAAGRHVNTVIFTGTDRHITFVHQPDESEIIEIQVIDIRPPDPPRLSDCISRLTEANVFGDLCIRFSEKTADISVYEGPRTVFPCSVSGLRGKYLDADTIREDGHLLVGCHMSRKIFETRFPELAYEFVDLCPMHSGKTKPDKPFIMRCCQSENSGKIVTIDGHKGIVVHWGASEYEICKAVRKLAGVLRKTVENEPTDEQ